MGVHGAGAGSVGGVALIGAFERDNFGDILFALTTSQYLSAFDLTFTGPFPGSSSELSEVRQYSDFVAEEPPSGVWVVGGEVGGVGLEYAYQMSADDVAYANYSEFSVRARRATLENLSRRNWASGAYLPRMSALEATHDATLVVNSVGLRAVGSLAGSRRAEEVQALREAAHLSVRDKYSLDLLKAMGISSLLAPDLIHSLRKSRAKARVGDYALIQMREADVSSVGPEVVAETLAKSPTFSGMPLRLFSAGSARMHDSTRLYGEIIDLALRINPALRISLSQARTAFEKVDEISGAALWVGTSLHGNIVSSAFDVARVGLDNAKVNRYAATWQEPMPYGVQWDRVEDAVVSALSLSDSSASSVRSTELAESAHSSAILGVRALSEVRHISSRRDAERRLLQARTRPIRRLVDRHPVVFGKARAVQRRLRER